MSPLLDLQALLLLPALGVALVAAAWWQRRRPGAAPLPRLAAFLTLLLFAALFFWRVLFTGGAMMPLGGGDLASFFYPIYSFIHQSIQQGNFPLWNPYAFGGMPLAPDVQSGMFYPPNLLAWFLLPEYSYATLEWLLIAHYLWASLGAYLWLRDAGAGRVAALAGAGAFSYSGFMSAHFGHMPMVFAAAWLPWHLLLARRTVVSRGWAWPILAGLALACAFLAGHPQTFLYEALAVALYWLFLLAGLPSDDQPGGEVPGAGRRPGRGGRFLLPLLKAAVSLLILAGLSAVQLLPSSELAAQSIRAAITFEQTGEHAMQPVGLINLVLPRVFGANPRDYWVAWQSTENWGYIGVVTLLLAGLGVLLWRNRQVAFLLALGALALLVMIGPFSVVFGWVHGLLPGFDRFRAPGRMLLPLSLAAAGLAALGVEGLWRLWSARSPRREVSDEAMPAGELLPAGMARVTPETMRGILYGLSAVVALVVFVAVPFFNAIFISSYSLERAQRVLNDVNLLAVWLLIALGLLWAGQLRRLASTSAVLLLGGLMLVDLFSATASFNPTSDDILAGYRQPAALAQIEQRLAGPASGRMDSDTGVEALWQPMLGTLRGIPEAGGLFNPLQLRRYTDFWNTVKEHRDNAVYDMLNIRFLVTTTGTRALDEKFAQIYDGDDGLKVYENRNAFPRVFIMHDAVVEPDDRVALGKLINGTYLPWHTVVFPAGEERRSATIGSVEGGSSESAQLLEYGPDFIRARVSAVEPGWAVFSEVWYPGWKATLDGQDVPVVRANVTLRAVAVPPGEHVVEMRFQPDSLATGALISGVTLVLALAGLVVALVAVSRRRASTS